MENILILDTETTGFDPAKDRVVEIAAVKYNLTYAAVVSCWSTLIFPPRDVIRKPASEWNPAESINGIPGGMLTCGIDIERAWLRLDLIAKYSPECEAIVAHNADFDKQWVPEKTGIFELPWVDTCNCVTWPKQTREAMNLTSLCLAHGVAVTDAHRALSDCLLLAKLLTRCAELGHNLEAIMAEGMRPRAMFEALVGYDERDKAKEKGFHWDADRKRWTRKVAIADVNSLGFTVRRIDS